MSVSTASGRLTLGAVGHFLLAGVLILALISGEQDVGLGGVLGGDASKAIQYLGLAFLVVGGLLGAMGYLGLSSGGLRKPLAALFAVLLGLAPILLKLFFDGARGDAAMSGMMVSLIVFFAVPGLLGVFGGLSLLGSASALAKPAGLVMLVSGIALLVFGGLLIANVALPEAIDRILLLVAFYGSLAGYILTGVAMLQERRV